MHGRHYMFGAGGFLIAFFEQPDRAVWTTYGSDDTDPASVDEATILSRLLALNGARAAAHG